jgi:nitrite reductase (NADH) large subunit
MEQHIIIGNGIAANTAAETIRKHEPGSSIRMFSREKHYFYYTPALPEFLSGEKDVKGVTLHNEQWYAERKIELYLNTEIASIDPAKKTVTTGDNDTFHYDKLLLATGGYSFVPPISGSDSAGGYSLRTLADAEAIKAKAAQSKKLVLIGGGLLGLEAGNGLRKAGLDVTVVEFFPRLLPRQMDVAGAAILQKQLEGMGFKFFLGAKTQEIAKAGSGLSVNLESGEKLPADMVLVSAGVRPVMDLAKQARLVIDKAVQVNDQMETSIADIYAAGDVVEHRGVFYGIWPASMEQGRIAGSNMAGASEVYTGTLPANKLKVVGIDLVAAGDIDADNKCEAVVHENQKNGVYRKFVIEKNRLAGAILFGDTRGSDAVMAAIKAGKDVSAFKDQLAQIDFDFSKFG